MIHDPQMDLTDLWIDVHIGQKGFDKEDEPTQQILIRKRMQIRGDFNKPLTSHQRGEVFWLLHKALDEIDIDAQREKKFGLKREIVYTDDT